MRRSAILAAAAAPMLLAGCAGIEYYAQAISGQLEILRRAEPIARALAEPGASASLKARLERVLAIRAFASRELALPDNGSYRRYADLGRPYVVWNVFAAPEFSIKPKESCFPFAGCVSYRGFFSEGDAQKHARLLRAEGYDIFIGGVPAYSTLGWFDDPVLSTFVNYPEAEVARLILHELAHQLLYVRDDSSFNESFAVTVEQEGVARWLKTEGSDAERRAWQTLQQRRREFVALVQQYRAKLDAYYAQPGSDEDKRAGKARLFREMHADYGELKRAWGGFSGYDRFLAKGANNALLASVVTYTEFVPAFRALLARGGGDLPRFYAEAKRISGLDKPEREARLMQFR